MKNLFWKIIDLLPEPKEVKINIKDARKEYDDINTEFAETEHEWNRYMENPKIDNIDKIMQLVAKRNQLIGRAEQIRKHLGVWIKQL